MYGLRRGQQWITAPEGDGPSGSPIPPVLAVSDSREHAWLASNIDDALERQRLLRMAFGTSTEVMAIR